ncbi:metallophosphoesterase [Gynurincola endophyticus]|uniref:metallophosphoesterase n=1 Tax=Gynurincola endophyticus TaxID=2479004 RepID=UPI000F8D84CD|nr:metallophosphoesterase [Gynurincola endophyticus]
MIKRILIVILLWLVVDFYFFAAVQTLTDNLLIHVAYWLVEAAIIGSVFYVIATGKLKLISGVIKLLVLSFVPKLAGALILLMEDLSRLFRSFPLRNDEVSMLAISVAIVLWLVLLISINRGRHYYKIRRAFLYFEDLPESFNDFTITHLSDIHAGSFTDVKGVQKGLDLVNAQKSDVILFTGDLVNNEASEMTPWIPAFARLKAPYGKYSVLGNHDYGDYIRWPDIKDKQSNFNRLKQVHQEIGFQLLLDDSKMITKGDDSIAIVGVENWGKGNFHKYGNLKKATDNLSDETFKILMSHDPSHWDAEIIDHNKPVQLTLSGHTHGMQFGFEIFGFRWSPIKYIYKQWAGLYKKAGKYLYVNRGFGFLGLNGRVGIWPEITVITLKRK